MKTECTQNSWNAVKTVLREKSIPGNIYIKKEKGSQINCLNFHLRKLEKKKKHTKPRARGKKEIIKIRVEISAIENRKTTGSQWN